MKKFYSFITVFIILVGSAYAQVTGNTVQQMDNAIKVLAGDLNRKIVDEKAQRVGIGQFTYRGGVTPFSAYWINQLTEELINTRNRTFNISPSGRYDLIISGEIVVIADVVRVYTQLIRLDNMNIVSVTHTNLEMDNRIGMMLSYSEGGSSSSVFADFWEPDDMDNPVTYDLAGNGAPVIERTLHSTSGGDEDFFLIVPDRDGLLVMETVGRTDTYMELYDADDGEELADDDDDGSDHNALIRHNVQAGKRYIVKVRGYDAAVGQYGFKAYFDQR